MRVLVVTPWLFPGGGGLERYAHTMSAHLARLGHDVTCVGHAPGPVDETREGVRRLGVPPAFRLSNTPLGLALRRRVARLLREEDVDVVNVHTPVPGSAEMAAHAARRAGVPYVVTYHAGTLGPESGPLALAARVHRVLFERRMLARAAGLVAVSPYVARHVFGGRPCAVVPPGVDAARFHPRGRPTPGRILFVGPVSRAYAWKGFGTLFEAFCRLAPFVPGAHLRAVGGGDLVAHYEALAAQRGLSGRVAFVPRVEEDRLPGEYQAAHVVVLPSTSPAESFGMVLAEANACGRPVVGSDVGGIPSFVEDGVNGLLAKPGDPASLSAALTRVLEDPALAARLGRAGREKVLECHPWERLAERTALELEAAGLTRLTRQKAKAARRAAS